jgi:hypothetical protein
MDEEYFESIRAVNQLALDYKRVGSMEKALGLQEELVSASTLSLGGDHPDAMAFIAELATTRSAFALKKGTWIPLTNHQLPKVSL